MHAHPREGGLGLLNPKRPCYIDSMMTSLLQEITKHRTLAPEAEQFIKALEGTIKQDLWGSAGGYWSEESIERIRATAMTKLNAQLIGGSVADVQQGWTEVVRDFHRSNWGEVRLEKKPVKPETKEQKIFWELFSYIWVLLQATLVTKTAVFYFGIKSAQEDDTSGNVYVILAILFSFVSLGWFGYRRHKKNKMHKAEGAE